MAKSKESDAPEAPIAATVIHRDPLKLSQRFWGHFKAMGIQDDPSKAQPKKADVIDYLEKNAEDIGSLLIDAQDYLDLMQLSDPTHKYARGVQLLVNKLKNVQQDVR